MCKARKISRFGWKNVMRYYGWKSFLKDSCLPLIISCFLCILQLLNNTDIFDQLTHVLSLGLAILPTMIALILAAYTIVISVFIKDFNDIAQIPNGQQLIQSLNASFAACLFIATFTTIIIITASCIARIGIDFEYSNIINYLTYFIVCFLTLHTICNLTGIIIDIYNCGQAYTHNKKNPS